MFDTTLVRRVDPFDGTERLIQFDRGDELTDGVIAVEYVGFDVWVGKFNVGRPGRPVWVRTDVCESFDDAEDAAIAAWSAEIELEAS